MQLGQVAHHEPGGQVRVRRSADDHPFQLGGVQPGHKRQELGVTEEDPRAGLGEDVLQKRATVGAVDRHLDRPAPHDAEPHVEELRNVGHHHRDAIAGRHPPLHQRGGHPMAGRRQLTGRRVAPRTPQERVVGVSRHRRL
jgi:hypothetical protein